MLLAQDFDFWDNVFRQVGPKETSFGTSFGVDQTRLVNMIQIRWTRLFMFLFGLKWLVYGPLYTTPKWPVVCFHCRISRLNVTGDWRKNKTHGNMKRLFFEKTKTTKQTCNEVYSISSKQQVTKQLIPLTMVRHKPGFCRIRVLDLTFQIFFQVVYTQSKFILACYLHWAFTFTSAQLMNATNTFTTIYLNIQTSAIFLMS